MSSFKCNGAMSWADMMDSDREEDSEFVLAAHAEEDEDLDTSTMAASSSTKDSSDEDDDSELRSARTNSTDAEQDWESEMVTHVRWEEPTVLQRTAGEEWLCKLDDRHCYVFTRMPKDFANKGKLVCHPISVVGLSRDHVEEIVKVLLEKKPGEKPDEAHSPMKELHNKLKRKKSHHVELLGQGLKNKDNDKTDAEEPNRNMPLAMFAVFPYSSVLHAEQEEAQHQTKQKAFNLLIKAACEAKTNLVSKGRWTH